MKAIDKALELRKSIHLRSAVPQREYDNRLRQPRRILKIVEDAHPRRATLYEARREYIVCLASAYEIFWRDMIKNLIDDRKAGQAKLKGLEALKMSMSEIADIFRHGMTLGELVSCSISFQGVAHVNKAVSSLLGIDAFSMFRKFRYRLYIMNPDTKTEEKGDSVCLGPEALKRSSFIDRCFEIRHDSVHNTGTRFSVSRDLVSRIEDAMWFFNLTFGLFTEKKFEELEGKP